MKYLLGGYSGMRNVADDVLLYATLAAVSRLDSQAAFTVAEKTAMGRFVPPAGGI